MDGKTWTVVQFLDDFTVEAIPSTWIQGNNCHWPSLATEKLYSAIRKSEPLNTCWPTHPIKIFRNATFGNYLVVRNKAKNAEDTSNLDTEPDDKIKRKIIQKVLSSSDESLNVSVLPSPPKIMKNKTAVKIDIQKNQVPEHPKHPVLDLEDMELEKENRPIDEDLHEQDASEVQEEQTFIGPREDLLTKQRLGQHFNGRQRMQAEQFIPCTSCQCKKCLEKDQNIKGLIQQGHILRSLANDTLAEVQASRKDLKKSANHNSEGETPVISFYTNVRELKTLGRSNLYDFVRRSLKTIVSNEMALKYSWLGRKGKKHLVP